MCDVSLSRILLVSNVEEMSEAVEQGGKLRFKLACIST